MHLLDPAQPSNDLGRATYGIKHIQAIFRAAHERLLTQRQIFRQDAQGFLGNGNVLDPILGDGSWATYVERRERLAAVGKRPSET